ncbi:MAG: hypothetical protein U0359_33560 [Byssovorax sp.]
MMDHRLLAALAFATTVVCAAPALAEETLTVTPPVTEERPIRDGVRLRFGMSLNGGWYRGLTGDGPAVGLAGRLGLQLGHYFGLYYQNTPILTFNPESQLRSGAGMTLGFSDYNSVLASLTLGHALELAAGPSYDYVYTVNCSGVFKGIASTIGCARSSFNGPGAHGRAALMLGGLVDRGPRRRGFTINGDVHPVFLPEGTAMTLTLGVGGDWY